MFRESILAPALLLAGSVAIPKVLPSPSVYLGATTDAWGVALVSALLGLVGGGGRALYRPALRRKLPLGLWTYPLLGAFVAGLLGMGAVSLFDYPPMTIYMASGFVAYFAPNILDRAEPKVERFIDRAGDDNHP